MIELVWVRTRQAHVLLGKDMASGAVNNVSNLKEWRAPLDVFFRPRNVAVVGGTEEKSSVGHSIVLNLQKTPFGGSIYPVNPKRASVFGLPCFPGIRDVPEKVDLAVIATPARTLPDVIRECAASGVEGVIIISAGFKE